MYFARENKIQQFSSYQVMLSSFLSGDANDEKTKSLFRSIIISAHNLITNKIEEDEIDHTIYPIVISLSDFKKEYTRAFFSNVNPKSIKKSDYVTLGSILNSVLTE